MNVPKVKGSHLAMKSGIVAAEAIVQQMDKEEQQEGIQSEFLSTRKEFLVRLLFKFIYSGKDNRYMASKVPFWCFGKTLVQTLSQFALSMLEVTRVLFHSVDQNWLWLNIAWLSNMKKRSSYFVIIFELRKSSLFSRSLCFWLRINDQIKLGMERTKSSEKCETLFFKIWANGRNSVHWPLYLDHERQRTLDLKSSWLVISFFCNFFVWRY